MHTTNTIHKYIYIYTPISTYLYTTTTTTSTTTTTTTTTHNNNNNVPQICDFASFLSEKATPGTI